MVSSKPLKCSVMKKFNKLYIYTITMANECLYIKLKVWKTRFTHKINKQYNV